MTSSERRAALLASLEERILVLDGAMGTMLQQAQLSAADFGGAQLEGCNEHLVISRPDVVEGIHRRYLEAGADIIETNSFGGTGIVLAEYGLEDQVAELNHAAARLARNAADAFSAPGAPRWVAGSIGPTTRAISVTGGIAFPELRAAFYAQARALWEGGVDLFLIETCQDTRNIKAATLAILQLRRESGEEIPFIVSGTIEPMGAMLAGQSAEALWVSLAHLPLLAIGLNCATGPEFMTDHLRTLASLAACAISCYPNAGLPDEDGRYLETPTTLAAQLERFAQRGWLNLVGGCCGTTDEHIRALAAMVQGKVPRRPPAPVRRSFYSGIEVVEAEPSTRPLLVGERTNVIGSRQFMRLVSEERWEEASEIARRQVRNGAQIVDVCLQSTERDELLDIPSFYEKLIRKIKAPLMIDTTDPRAIELALTYCQGKSLINSINLEDGELKFQHVAPLVRQYGAAVVVGCIDEDPAQAQAFTRERKLAVARRSVQLLVEKYGLAPEDIIIDPLVFPCATGDENYIGGAVETLEGIRLIKAELPEVRTILGVSNISFGLPAAAREVVNSVFLYHATRAGLDLAIVNSEKIERFASIPARERELAEALLFNSPPAAVPPDHSQAGLLHAASADWRQQTREQKIAVNQFHIAVLNQHFRQAGVRQRAAAASLSLEERLARYIVEGSKDGLIDDLDRKLATGARPLDIINGPLMSGMSEVGRLFNDNELIVAEVLQSAESMKASVAHLQQFMEKADALHRGRILLATVKGDVHDIGKNLVDIILSNNGFEVINLGIKVPPEALIEAWHRHQPDAIGLSGLLVKSAQQMVITASDLREAGVRVPLLVGGAALSERFTRSKIAPAYSELVCYARDAMTGLDLMNRVMTPGERERLQEASKPITADKLPQVEPENGVMSTPAAADARPDAAASPEAQAGIAIAEPPRRSNKIRADLPIPAAPYLERRVRPLPDLAELWSYINPHMLYRHHLGFKGNFEQALAERDRKALELEAQVEELKQQARALLRPRAVWQFYEAEAEGNSLHLFAPGDARPLHSFHFERQPRPEGLCLADYVLPARGAERDHLALFVVTAGAGVRESSELARRQGRYFESHGIQVLALETAEAAAEYLHRRLREDWGFTDPPGMTMQQRFTSRYRGKRYSFGYPACPNLNDQAGLWKLLRPEEIGVELTEGMMMDPEASVSALVFHHPDCSYFSVSEEAAGRAVPG